MITDKKHVSPVNYLVLNKAKKMLLVFGKTKVRKWFSDSEETYEELANKMNLSTLREEINGYKKSFFVIRIFRRLFTSIQLKRTLLAYMETHKLLAPLEISKSSISFRFYINFVQQRIEQISYFSPLRSTLQKISNFFVKKSFTRKKVKLRTNNMQHKNINLMINKISDLHEEIMLLLLSLSKQDNFSKIMKLYQEWKQLSIKYMRDLKDPLEIKAFKEHHYLCEQNIVPKIAQYSDQLSQKECKINSKPVVENKITNTPIADNNSNNVFSGAKLMASAPHYEIPKQTFVKTNLFSTEIKKEEEIKREAKTQNAALVDFTFDETPKSIEVDHELNLLHCFSDALKEMEAFMKSVKKNPYWHPHGNTEQKEIAHFRRTFKKILICCHPDKNPILLKSLAEDNFKSINEQLIAFNNILEKKSREIFIEDFQICLSAISLKKIAEERNLQIRNQKDEEIKEEEREKKRAESFNEFIEASKKELNDLMEGFRVWEQENARKDAEWKQTLMQELEQQYKVREQEFNQQLKEGDQLSHLIAQHMNLRNQQIKERDQQISQAQLNDEVPQVSEIAEKIKSLDQQIKEQNRIIVLLFERFRGVFFKEITECNISAILYDMLNNSSKINLSGLQDQGLFANLARESTKKLDESSKAFTLVPAMEDSALQSLNMTA